MRKFLFCLLTLFAITPAFSENYIVFKATAVENAINTLVPADKRVAVRDEYQKQMDATTGKISVSGVYKVCNTAGFKIKERGGYEDCQSFVGMIVSESGSGSATQQSCTEELDGIWTQTADGKTNQCVGRDGSVLNYRNACKDKKEGDSASQCWENTFSAIYLQYAVAKNAIQIWAKEKLGNIDLTCKNQKTISKNKDPYLYCSAKGKPYTFKFNGFGPRKDADAERMNIMSLMCKLADQNLKFGMATSSKHGVGGTCLCKKCSANGEDYPLGDVSDGWEKCGKVGEWGKRLGGYNTMSVNDGVVSSGSIWSHGSAIAKGMCFIYGGVTSTSSLVNEMEAEGIDNLIFMDISVRNSEDVINKVRGYAREVMGANKVKSAECDSTFKTVSSVDPLGIFEKKSADVITCHINGKRVDFAFKNLSTKTDFRTKGGLQGFDCKVQQGTYTGKDCIGLSQEKCNKIKAANAKDCPECKEITWNAELEQCVLPNSANVRTVDKIEKVAALFGITVGAVAATVVTGGAASTAGVALLLVEVSGFYVEVGSTLVIYKHAQDFLNDSVKCNDATCAENLIKKLPDLAAEQHDYEDTEIHEIDRQLERLVDLIPDDSEIWQTVGKEMGLESNDQGLKDWTPAQVWRAVGVAMQMAGLFSGVVTKFFGKGTKGLTNGTTKIVQKAQKALPAAQEAKLLTHADDEVKLLAGSKMSFHDAQEVENILTRNGKRLAGTATDYERGIHTTGLDLPTKDRETMQVIMKRYGYSSYDDMYMEAHAVVQTKAIMDAEAQLAKQEERLAYLIEHNGSKQDIRMVEAQINTTKQNLAAMGRTYSSVADEAVDAARGTTNAIATTDNVAASAARGATRSAAEIDNAYAVGRTATTRSEILEKWGLRADATDAEITARYRELSRNFHPDRAGAEFTDVMADINKERELLRTLPYENPSRLLALPEATAQATTKTAEVVPMIGHNLIGAVAAGRALSRVVNPEDTEIATRPVAGGNFAYGDDSGNVVMPGTPIGSYGEDGVSGTMGGTLPQVDIVADRIGGTSGNQNAMDSTTPTAVSGASSDNTTSTTNNSTGKKSGISGLGAAAIGAGVAGLGVGAALLIGRDKDSGAATTGTSSNVDVFNNLNTKAKGILGYVDGSAIELIPIETLSGAKENIVSISRSAVVLVKHNGNTIPFFVDTQDGVAHWAPFTHVDASTGVFTRYEAKVDIMRTAQISEKLAEALPPLQIQYFATPNVDGVQFVAPSAKGYGQINNNDLRHLALNIYENTRSGVFLMA